MIEINAAWRYNAAKQNIIGVILVTDENDKQLMHDEKEYPKPADLWDRVSKLFVKNPRFKITQKMLYNKQEQMLKIIAEDLKGVEKI